MIGLLKLILRAVLAFFEARTRAQLREEQERLHLALVQRLQYSRDLAALLADKDSPESECVFQRQRLTAHDEWIESLRHSVQSEKSKASPEIK